MILEIIACSLDDALAAEQGGATRLEVVSHLDQDGLTPSFDLVEAILVRVQIPIRVMVRERNTLDVTDADELARLHDSAQQFCQLPIDGLVMGFASVSAINTTTLTHMSDLHNRITFHRAFDECADPTQAINVLKRFASVDCILTSGGAGDWGIRTQRLTTLQRRAGDIAVLIGDGVDETAIRTVCETTTLRAFHVGRAVREPQETWGRVSKNRVAALRNTLTTFCLP